MKARIIAGILFFMGMLAIRTEAGIPLLAAGFILYWIVRLWECGKMVVSRSPKGTPFRLW